MFIQFKRHIGFPLFSGGSLIHTFMEVFGPKCDCFREVRSQIQMMNADCILHAALEADRDQVTTWFYILLLSLESAIQSLDFTNGNFAH